MADFGSFVYATPGRWLSGRRIGGAITAPVNDFVLGTTDPAAIKSGTARFAGLPDGWAPAQTFTTQQYFTTNGQTINNVRFDAKTDIQIGGNVFNNCDFRGSNSAMGRAAVWANHANNTNGPQTVFNNCRFAPQYASNTNDSFQGYNAIFNNCEFYHGVDGFGSYIPVGVGGSDARLQINGCWIHDLAYFCPDTGGQSTGQTHNDGNQLHNGTNILFEGTRVDGYWAPDFGVGALDPGVKDANGKWISGNANSLGVANGPLNCNAVLQMNVMDTVGNFKVRRCWLTGGITTINALDTSLSGFTLELTGNRIGLPMNGNKNSILKCASAAAVTLTASGNTLLDGTPISFAVGDGRLNSA